MTVNQFLGRVNELILNPLIGLAFALAFAYFVYSIVKYLSLDVSDSKSRKEMQDAIMWGIVGMIIMFCVYGIIHFVLATFGISNVPPEVQKYIR